MATSPSVEQENVQLREQIEALKEENDRLKQQFLVSEQEEELITNNLLKKLEEKKKEQEALVLQLEQEEEYLTNTLQQKLNTLRKEKVELENQLEQEEEFLTNKLQKTIIDLQKEYDALSTKLEESEEIREKLQSELKEVREQSKKKDTEYNICLKRNNRLRQQIEKLKTDNFVLNQRINSGQQKFNEIKQEKFRLEADIERQSEMAFNTQNRTPNHSKRLRSTSYSPGNIISASVPTSSGIAIPGAGKYKRMQVSPDNSLDFAPSPISMGMMSPVASSPISIKMKSPGFGDEGSSVGSSPATPFLSSSFVDSFLHSRASEQNTRSCIKRGWLKKRNNEGRWVQCMFVVYDNGEMMFCDSESGITSYINLDTVASINDLSKKSIRGNQLLGFYPNLTFEIQSNNASYILNCESSQDFKEWTQLLEELSPMG